MRVGSNSMKKAKARQLRQEYMALAFCDEEAVVDFTLRLQSSQQSANNVSIAITDKEAVTMYLWVMPTKYAQIMLSIETLIDLATLSLKDAIGHLKAVEDCVEMAVTTASDKVLLTKEWVAQMHEKRSEEGSSSRSGNGKRRGKAPQKKDDDDASRLVNKDTC
jgi:hypothetical protein